MSTTTNPTFDLDRFARAAEERDASTQLSMYAPDATVTIADRISQPGSPRVLCTRAEIRSWLRGHLRPRHDPLGPTPGQGRVRSRLHAGVPLPRRDKRVVRDGDRARRRADLTPARRPGLGRAVIR